MSAAPPVLLYGLGRSGLAAGRLAARQGRTVRWTDRDPTSPDAAAARAEGWGAPVDVAADADGPWAACIAAPGVPWEHPDLRALRARGVETIGEIEWVHRTIDAPMIGITGTAGKGTVTRWTDALLHAAGVDAVAGGNLDPALAAVATPGRWLVAEISSFQLERSPTLRPRVAVVTVLGRDHLDRHGDLATYHAVKRRLLAHLGPGDVAILNADDPHQAGWAAPVRAAGAEVRTVSAAGAPDAHARLAPAADGAPHLWVGPHDLGPDRLAVPGRPARANALAALAAADAAGADPAALAAHVPHLRGLPGRHERIAEACGVRFVDDAIATRELAVHAALEAAPPPIAWIVGGRDKGADPRPLVPLVEAKVDLVLAIGEAGPTFARTFEGHADVRVLDAPDGGTAMADAVRVGAEHLAARGGGTVLLAPLAASFDQFPHYRARGDAFRAATHALLAEASWTDCS